MSLNFRPLPLSTRQISRVRRIFENILLAGSCIRFTYCTDTTCIIPEAQKQRSGNQKNRHLRPKPSMILADIYHDLDKLDVCSLISTTSRRQKAIINRLQNQYQLTQKMNFTTLHPFQKNENSKQEFLWISFLKSIFQL